MDQHIPIYEEEITDKNMRLYSVNFFGEIVKVTVTSAASVVRRWLNTTRYLNHQNLHRLVVGTGVQWVGEYPAATLQLCVGRRCLIYQLAHAEKVPNALRKFLTSKSVTLVGLWNYLDATKLWESEHEIDVRRLIDLRYYARGNNNRRLVRASVKEIVEEFLGYEGVSVNPAISRSDWDDEDLSDDQVRQACVDAYVSFRIGRDIWAWTIPARY